MYRVLMFASGFAPYSFSENLVNSKLAMAMLEAGWDLEVISARDDGPVYEVKWGDPWLPLRARTHEIAYDHGGSFGRLAQRALDVIVLGHPIAGVRWGRRALDVALRLHAQKPFDVVVSRSVSDFAHLPAIRFARKTDVPWVANWNDPPGYLFPKPYMYRVPRVKRVLNDRYLRASARIASCNTFPCRRLANYLAPHLGLTDGKRVRVLPHVSWSVRIPASPQTAAHFRLCHAGNLSAERDARPFLLALKRLAAEVPAEHGFRFEMIGVFDERLSGFLVEHGIERYVSCVPGMSYLSVLERLARSQVLVVIEAPLEEGIFLPSKVADYVQVGRPILAVSPAEGTMCDLLGQHGGGLSVDCTSVESVYLGLRRLYDAWINGKLMEFSPDRLCELFSARLAISQLDSVFEEIGRTAGRRVVRG